MAEQHIVIENIDALIREGLVVYDANNERIGHVRDYSTAAAYMVVHAGLITHKDLYVPFSAIRSIDARDVFLTLDQGALLGDYGAPPPATIVVEGATTATVVSSGYDGRPAEVNRVNLETVRRDLARGMAVYATSGEQVGAIDGIDNNVGYMLVKQHHFSKKDLFIPFAAIDTIDSRYGYVFLAVSKDVLLKDYTRLPNGTVLRVDAVAPGGDVIQATVVEHSEP